MDLGGANRVDELRTAARSWRLQPPSSSSTAVMEASSTTQIGVHDGGNPDGEAAACGEGLGMACGLHSRTEPTASRSVPFSAFWVRNSRLNKERQAQRMSEGTRAHTLSPPRHHAVEVEARSNSPACCTVKGLNNHILLHDLSTHSVSICSSAAHVTYPPCKIGLIADKIHILGETDHFSSQFMHWINHA